MPRRLKVSERPPQNGDVLYGESGHSYVVSEVLPGNKEGGYPFYGPNRVMQERDLAESWWTYKHRADGGPVMVED